MGIINAAQSIAHQPAKMLAGAFHIDHKRLSGKQTNLIAHTQYSLRETLLGEQNGIINKNIPPVPAGRIN